MQTMAVAQRMTADEFLALPWEGMYRELVAGEVVVERPLNLHQWTVQELFGAFRDWVSEAPGRGRLSLELDVRIDERNVYGPDLMWYAEGRAPTRRDPRPYPVPDIAVEVRSPSTWRYDIGAKKAGYERVGLPELWLVDTAADEVLVFRRAGPHSPTFDVALELAIGDTLTSALLPGFALDLKTLFAD
jgi:Uma2 family endonuclease